MPSSFVLTVILHYLAKLVKLALLPYINCGSLCFTVMSTEIGK